MEGLYPMIRRKRKPLVDVGTKPPSAPAALTAQSASTAPEPKQDEKTPLQNIPATPATGPG